MLNNLKKQDLVKKYKCAYEQYGASVFAMLHKVKFAIINFKSIYKIKINRYTIRFFLKKEIDVLN